MSGDAEWGPWIDHDGKGCPCVGQWVERELTTGGRGRTKAGLTNWTIEGVVLPECAPAWDWSLFGKRKPNGMRRPKVTRYRVRKPKGMEILHAILENLPVPAPKQIA